jgi:phosphoglucosamine mutase
MTLFGTSGIRGTVGEDVTADLALSVGRAVASDGAERGVLGRDHPRSGRLLAAAASAGARECGATVLDAGRTSTPALARAVGREGADAGVMITASHNPAPDNGLKLWNPSGQAFDTAQQEAIERRIAEGDYDLRPWDGLGEERPLAGVDEHHVAALVESLRASGGDDRPLDGLTVAVDVGNGAGGATADALTELGAAVHTLNAQPDGRFPSRPSEPTAENCEALREFVAGTDADLGVAHDGDADRMRACTESGRFVDGNVNLALFAATVAREGSRVAAPLNVSLAVEDALEAKGASLTRTRVGDVFVAEAATADDVVFGGEESGAWIWPDETLCPDGPLAACKLAALVAREGSLDELVDDVATYPHRYEVLETDRKRDLMAVVEELVRAEYGDDRITAIDGVHVRTDDGWFMIRASGTEPKIRYRGEARDEADARRLLELAEGFLGGAQNRRR